VEIVLISLIVGGAAGYLGRAWMQKRRRERETCSTCPPDCPLVEKCRERERGQERLTPNA
jgi:hypothetical protein